MFAVVVPFLHYAAEITYPLGNFYLSSVWLVIWCVFLGFLVKVLVSGTDEFALRIAKNAWPLLLGAGATACMPFVSFNAEEFGAAYHIDSECGHLSEAVRETKVCKIWEWHQESQSTNAKLTDRSIRSYLANDGGKLFSTATGALPVEQLRKAVRYWVLHVRELPLDSEAEFFTIRKVRARPLGAGFYLIDEYWD